MDYTSLGARIRRERVLHSWTQEQLAEKVNISVSFLGHIERGTRKASLETLVSISNVLDISLDYLLCDSLALSPKRTLCGNLPPRKQLALQEILRSVEEALCTWSDGEQKF